MALCGAAVIAMVMVIVQGRDVLGSLGALGDLLKDMFGEIGAAASLFDKWFQECQRNGASVKVSTCPLTGGLFWVGIGLTGIGIMKGAWNIFDVANRLRFRFGVGQRSETQARVETMRETTGVSKGELIDSVIGTIRANASKGKMPTADELTKDLTSVAEARLGRQVSQTEKASIENAAEHVAEAMKDMKPDDFGPE